MHTLAGDMSPTDFNGRRVLVTGAPDSSAATSFSALSADGAQVRVVDLQPHPDRRWTSSSGISPIGPCWPRHCTAV